MLFIVDTRQNSPDPGVVQLAAVVPLQHPEVRLNERLQDPTGRYGLRSGFRRWPGCGSRGWPWAGWWRELRWRRLGDRPVIVSRLGKPQVGKRTVFLVVEEAEGPGDFACSGALLGSLGYVAVLPPPLLEIVE